MRPPHLPIGSVGPPRPSGEGEVRPPVSVSFLGVAMALTIAIVVGTVLYAAQFSGTLQWAIGVAGLAVLAGLAWRLVVRSTSEPSPLVAPAPADAIRPGELGALSRAVTRAARGLPYSQVNVSSRARAAFLEHARLALGLSPEAMREAQADPNALRRLIADEVLAEFLHLRTGDADGAYGWVDRARGRGGFGPEFQDVLDRMEAWR